jgi:hypothetical protein
MGHRGGAERGWPELLHVALASCFVKQQKGMVVKRFASLALSAGAMAGAVFVLAAGAASAAGPSPLPTLTLALNGKTVTVGGSTVSGAVNVVTTVTGEPQGQPTLVRLNPGVSFAAFGAGVAAVAAHHGDFNYLNPYASIVFDATANKGTSSAQTVLAPGNYFALDTGGRGVPPHAAFVVTQAASPATLPKPAATESTIDFAFRGPTTLHDGELVRFQNDGFVVHMDTLAKVKDVAAGRKVMALMLAGKDNAAMRLVTGFGTFAGPLSTGGMQQSVVNLQPGVWVQACFMDTQDGREHTVLRMERMIRIQK